MIVKLIYPTKKRKTLIVTMSEDNAVIFFEIMAKYNLSVRSRAVGEMIDLFANHGRIMSIVSTERPKNQIIADLKKNFADCDLTIVSVKERNHGKS